MLLKANYISELLRNPPDQRDNNDPLIISPSPSLEELDKDGAASVDLRLGSWFLATRQSRMTHLSASAQNDDETYVEYHYVPFNEVYILHPRCFVLGVTLEWLRIPTNLAGYVNGKSSWGRRGLIIATAAAVHPGFKGCLTLEITNLGEIPIEIMPNMRICQLSLHTVHSAEGDKDSRKKIDKSGFVGMRKPELGTVKYG